MALRDILRGFFCRGRKVQAEPLGARGEALAARYIQRNLGMKVVARNERFSGGELDIVAIEGTDIVFIEVRTRQTEAFGSPERTIRTAKRRFLRHAAKLFIAQRRLENLTPRFDVVAIIWPKEGDPEIRHHRNAFPPR